MINVVTLAKEKPVVVVVSAVAAIGVGIATYFVSGKVKEKIDERRGVETIEWPDIPFGVNEDENALDEDCGPDDDEDEDDDDDDDISSEERVVAEPFRKPDISTMVDYTKYSKVVQEVIEGLSDIPEEQEDDPNFEIIDEKDYLDTSVGFAKADATYFVKDEILAGWNEDLSPKDIDSTVGKKAVNMFSDPSVKSVYVRNIELKVDYEIVRCDDPFDEVVREAVMEE